MPSLLRNLCLLSLLIPTTAISAQSDFAYQASLGEVDQPLQRVPLSLEIILALTRADLGDIAVFNAQGKQQVHTIMRAPKPIREFSRTLAFHEFSRFRRQHSKTVTTREQNQQAGSLSELKTTQTVPVQTLRKDYLIELVEPLGLADDESTPNFERIDLQWTHEPADQILELKVEAGNALDDLHVIKPRKSLTNLESSDQGWRSIEGIPSGYRYLRLTPLNNITRFELQRVDGHTREIGTAPDLRHHIKTELIVDDETGYYSIPFLSRVNADSIRIIPASSNSVITGKLYASWDDADTKVLIKGKFRQHNIENADIRPSEPIKLSSRPFRSIAFTSTVAVAEAPTIELIYPQYELLFLGDGNGPYSLAWGNHESSGPVSDLSAILQGSLQQAQQDAGLVRLGTIEESGGQARLTPQPELPWKKWLLWTLLILAVIVTARMASKLYREMNPTPST
jgi:hypothetical protein